MVDNAAIESQLAFTNGRIFELKAVVAEAKKNLSMAAVSALQMVVQGEFPQAAMLAVSTGSAGGVIPDAVLDAQGELLADRVTHGEWMRGHLAVYCSYLADGPLEFTTGFVRFHS